MKYRVRPRVGDFLVMAAILALAWLLPAVTLGAPGEARTAVVTVDGAEVCRISLTGTESVWIPIDGAGGIHLTVEAQNGRVRFSGADCRDRVCVDTGWLREPGRSAVCLPGRAVLRVEGSSGGVDAVTR